MADSLYNLVVADSFPWATSFFCSRSHAKYVENRRKKKLSNFSSHHFDDSVTTV